MSNSLNFYYQNTRGLRTKIRKGNLKKKFTLANYDCASLTETWLNDDFYSSEIFDDQYNVFRSDRTITKYNSLRVNRPNLLGNDDVFGEGSLIALRKNISALRMLHWENEVSFDNVWLKLNTHNKMKLFIHTIYLQGWANFEQVKSYFEIQFEIINVREPYSRFIILGDFNLSCIEWISNGNHCIPILPKVDRLMN